MKHDFPIKSPTMSELLSELKEKGVKYRIQTLNRLIKHCITDENGISYDFGYERGEPAESIKKKGQEAHYYKGALKKILVFSKGSFGPLERTVYFDDEGEISREETVEESRKRLKEERGGIPTIKDKIQARMKNGDKKPGSPKI